uniref:Uncharacterized protein n=1 Tax=Anguilla anguilla TaxID=7936 RepID=A0A0E9VDL2_ANGAN
MSSITKITMHLNRIQKYHHVQIRQDFMKHRLRKFRDNTVYNKMGYLKIQFHLFFV